MRLKYLRANNIRCFKRLDYEPSLDGNLICGFNGSGKSTILEAIHLVGFGKSFLSTRLADLVTRGGEELSLHAAIHESEASSSETIVQLRKDRKRTDITCDGQPVRSASSLARYFPLLLINSRAPDLLVESPSNRRSLLDRSLFHVEHNYLSTWKAYRNALNQRNSLLQSNSLEATQLAFWEAKLESFGDEIHRQRLALISFVNSAIVAQGIPSLSGREIRFEYSSGWDHVVPLSQQLRIDRVRDSALGYTVCGPHRADLVLRIDNQPGARKLSRGQAKAVVCTVLVAIAHFVDQMTARPPVLLVDDIAAELDDRTLQSVIEAILSIGAQSFFTAIKQDEVARFLPSETLVFHVEH